MVILTLNCGSSSVKYQVYHWHDQKVLARGLVERVGSTEAVLEHTTHHSETLTINREIPNHQTAIQMILDTIVDSRVGVVKKMDDVVAVGHRVLHGGDIKTSQVFKATGPDAFAHSLRESSSAVDYISCSTLDPVKPRNKHLAAGGPAALARFPDAYAVHHGVSSWMGGGDFLNGLTCVYGAYYEVSSILAPVFMLAFIGALVAVIVLATRKK